MSVTEMFSYIQGFLSADQDVREVRKTNTETLKRREIKRQRAAAAITVSIQLN